MNNFGADICSQIPFDYNNIDFCNFSPSQDKCAKGSKDHASQEDDTAFYNGLTTQATTDPLEEEIYHSESTYNNDFNLKMAFQYSMETPIQFKEGMRPANVWSSALIGSESMTDASQLLSTPFQENKEIVLTEDSLYTPTEDEDVYSDTKPISVDFSPSPTYQEAIRVQKSQIDKLAEEKKKKGVQASDKNSAGITREKVIRSIKEVFGGKITRKENQKDMEKKFHSLSENDQLRLSYIYNILAQLSAKEFSSFLDFYEEYNENYYTYWKNRKTWKQLKLLCKIRGGEFFGRIMEEFLIGQGQMDMNDWLLNFSSKDNSPSWLYIYNGSLKAAFMKNFIGNE